MMLFVKEGSYIMCAYNMYKRAWIDIGHFDLATIKITIIITYIEEITNIHIHSKMIFLATLHSFSFPRQRTILARCWLSFDTEASIKSKIWRNCGQILTFNLQNLRKVFFFCEFCKMAYCLATLRLYYYTYMKWYFWQHFHAFWSYGTILTWY